jgi:hypothetical protein
MCGYLMFFPVSFFGASFRLIVVEAINRSRMARAQSEDQTNDDTDF